MTNKRKKSTIRKNQTTGYTEGRKEATKITNSEPRKDVKTSRTSYKFSGRKNKKALWKMR
ncbi:MAG: hypothetical protein LBU27_06350 [Candidatus Peribacteria bacterium]|jgi:hypothetical protein|nr:hypothetical protein [Candidatus Peribacteria bacterium]